MRSYLAITRVLLGLLPLILGSSACYTHAGNATHIPTFETETGTTTVVGRDCSFHLAGLAWRDLSTRQAALNAVDGTRVTLENVTSRIVYPAPFEVCIEVEGRIADADLESPVGIASGKR